MSLHSVSRRSLLLGGLVAAGAVVLPGRTGRAEAPVVVTQLVVWGDSMAQTWPKYLADITGLPVVRRSAGGETIEETYARFVTWTAPATGHIVWSGHVNANRQNDSLHLVPPTMQQMADQAAAQGSRFMPLSLTNGPDSALGSESYEDIVLWCNPQLQAAHPDYLEMRRYLVTDGLDRARLDPMQRDYLDVGLDMPPSSLRTTKGNPSHLNTPGREVVAARVAEHAATRGWLG